MITNLKSFFRPYLLRIQKITHVDMVYIARGGFWLTFGTTASSFIGLFIALIYANLLPREVYGTYKYILSIVAILNAFSLTGMNTAVARAVARGFEGALWKSFVFQLRWGIFQFIAALVIAGYYFIHGNTNLGIAFLCISVLAPLSSSANTWSAFLEGKKNFKTQSVYNIISTIFVYVAIIVAIFIKKDATFIIFANLAGSAAINLFLIWRTMRVFKPNTKFETGILSYGTHLTFISIFGILVSQLDSLILFHTLGPVQLSIFAFATIIPDRIKSFSKQIGALAFPKYAERSIETIRVGFFRKLAGLVGILAVISCIYIIVSPWFYSFFFPQYRESIPLTALYGITIIASAFSIPLALLQSKARKKELYAFTLLVGAVQIPSSFLFIHYYGTMGAIYGKIFCLFFQFALVLFLVRNMFWYHKTA